MMVDKNIFIPVIAGAIGGLFSAWVIRLGNFFEPFYKKYKFSLALSILIDAICFFLVLLIIYILIT